MDKTLDLMVKAEQPINPLIYCDFMTYNIQTITAYGYKYDINNPDINGYKLYDLLLI